MRHCGQDFTASTGESWILNVNPAAWTLKTRHQCCIAATSVHDIPVLSVISLVPPPLKLQSKKSQVKLCDWPCPSHVLHFGDKETLGK